MSTCECKRPDKRTAPALYPKNMAATKKIHRLKKKFDDPDRPRERARGTQARRPQVAATEPRPSAPASADRGSGGEGAKAGRRRKKGGEKGAAARGAERPRRGA